jgi:hypothetical protein
VIQDGGIPSASFSSLLDARGGRASNAGLFPSSRVPGGRAALPRTVDSGAERFTEQGDSARPAKRSPRWGGSTGLGPVAGSGACGTLDWGAVVASGMDSEFQIRTRPRAEAAFVQE